MLSLSPFYLLALSPMWHYRSSISFDAILYNHHLLFVLAKSKHSRRCAFPFLFPDREQSFLDVNASGPLLLSSSSIYSAPASQVVHEHQAGAQRLASLASSDRFGTVTRPLCHAPVHVFPIHFPIKRLRKQASKQSICKTEGYHCQQQTNQS